MQSRFDNSTDLELLRSIEKGSVDLVLTDPPYLISKDSGMQRLKDSEDSTKSMVVSTLLQLTLESGTRTIP